MTKPQDRRADFLQRLGLTIPIIQAPMAGVSTPAMAAAVANAGALGSLGIGAATADGAQRMILQTRELTQRSLNVNVFCHRPAARRAAIESAWLDRLRREFAQYDAQPPTSLTEIYTSFLTDEARFETLVALRPEALSFHFGLPTPAQVRILRNAQITLIASATTLAEARAAEAAGMDAVVAQGYEAGGHRGSFDPGALDDRLGTMALTRLLVSVLRIPVIAAGGITDGAGISAALALGAAAAQLGTAFIACPESSADSGYRAALHSDAAHHTVMTAVISGRPARCLANRFTALGKRLAPEDIPAYPLAYSAGKALHAAAKAQLEFGYGAQWAGQGAPLARTLPAAELIRVLAAEIGATGQSPTRFAGRYDL